MAQVTHVTCHVSRVTWHMSRVTCHMARVLCHNFFLFKFFLEKEVKLVGGGSVINGATPSSLLIYTFFVFFICCFNIL